MFGGIEKMGQEEFAEKLKRTKDGEPVVAMEKLTGRPIRGFLDWESAYGWKDSLPSPVAALYELQGTIGKKTIVEHISAGDLEHIVLPLISCDEYTPKDDEGNIVFAFFVRGVPEAVEPLRAVGDVIAADIEAGPWPLAGRTFDLVLVCNYLWRPLLDTVLASVAPGGSLIYETFANGQQRIGRPSRPDFLLQRAELLAHLRGWEVTAFEDMFEPAGSPGVNARFVQRVAARRPQL
jgi:hypothetical protein